MVHIKISLKKEKKAWLRVGLWRYGQLCHYLAVWPSATSTSWTHSYYFYTTELMTPTPAPRSPWGFNETMYVKCLACRIQLTVVVLIMI